MITVPGAASKLAFSPDGRFLLTLTDSEARVYEATPPPTRSEMPAAVVEGIPREPTISNESPPDPLPADARAALRNGEAALSDADPAAALLWSVRAPKNDPGRATLHRVHVGLLLQSLPPLGGKQPEVPLTPELPPKPDEGQFGSTLSDDGRLIAYYKFPFSAGDRRFLQVFDVRTGRAAGPRIRLSSELHACNTPLCFVPGGRRIVVCLRPTDKDHYVFRTYEHRYRRQDRTRDRLRAA